MVTARRGAGKLGCLFSLLLLAAVVYFAVGIGEVYMRYYEYADAMRQEVRFAATRSDDDIRRRLASLADSLGLPDEAGRVRVRREARRISISADYTEQVALPLMVRDVRLQPRAAGPL